MGLYDVSCRLRDLGSVVMLKDEVIEYTTLREIRTNHGRIRYLEDTGS